MVTFGDWFLYARETFKVWHGGSCIDACCAGPKQVFQRFYFPHSATRLIEPLQKLSYMILHSNNFGWRKADMIQSQTLRQYATTTWYPPANYTLRHRIFYLLEPLLESYCTKRYTKFTGHMQWSAEPYTIGSKHMREGVLLSKFHA